MLRLIIARRLIGKQSATWYNSVVSKSAKNNDSNRASYFLKEYPNHEI